MALAALLQLGLSVAIQPAGARETGLDLQTVGTYADSEAGEQITTASQGLLKKKTAACSSAAKGQGGQAARKLGHAVTGDLAVSSRKCS